MSIVSNTNYSSIEATSIMILRLKLTRDKQQSSASKKVVPMANFEDFYTKTMCLPLSAPNSPMKAACNPPTPKSTGAIGNWLKKAKFYEKKPAPISPIRAACCSLSTSKSTGAIGKWMKRARFHKKKHSSLLMAGELRKASTTQQYRQRKGGFPLAATKKGRSSVEFNSMSAFRAQWSNGPSRDQHVNREVFARRLQRGTLVIKTRK
jgi:hypothetical protein